MLGLYNFLLQVVLKPEETVSLSNIVPPSVRIEGCTPPSENNSLDGEISKYLRFGQPVVMENDKIKISENAWIYKVLYNMKFFPTQFF